MSISTLKTKDNMRYKFTAHRPVREGSRYPETYKNETERVLAAQTKKHLTPVEKVAVPLGKLGASSWSTVFGTYRLTFLTSILFAGFDYKSEIASVITILTIINYVVNILVSPVIGMLIARTRGRFGRYKPYGLLLNIPYLITCALMFYSPAGLDYTGKVIYVCVTYALYTVFNTCMTTAENLVQVMTPNQGERNSWLGFLGIVSSVGSVVPLVFYLVFDLAGLSLRDNYLLLCLLFGVFQFISQALFYSKVKERMFINPVKIKFSTGMFKPFKYKPYLIYQITTWLRIFAGLTGVVSPLLAGVVLGTEKMILFSLPTGAGTVFGLVLCNLLLKKFKPLTMMRFIGFYSLFVGIAAAIVGPFAGVPFYILYFCYGITYGFHNVLPNILNADVNDYLEWKTGQRMETTSGIVAGYVSRGITAIRDALFAYMLIWAGYEAAVTEGQTVLEANLAHQEFTATILLIYAVGIPAVFFAIMSVLYCFFDLEGSKKEEMHRELQLQRARFAEETRMREQQSKLAQIEA